LAVVIPSHQADALIGIVGETRDGGGLLTKVCSRHANAVDALVGAHLRQGKSPRPHICFPSSCGLYGRLVHGRTCTPQHPPNFACTRAAAGVPRRTNANCRLPASSLSARHSPNHCRGHGRQIGSRTSREIECPP
jgi:hypothetical protein